MVVPLQGRCSQLRIWLLSSQSKCSWGYNLLIVFQRLLLGKFSKDLAHLVSVPAFQILFSLWGTISIWWIQPIVSSTKPKMVAWKPSERAVSVGWYTHSNKLWRTRSPVAAALGELLSLLSLQVPNQPELWAPDHFLLVRLMLGYNRLVKSEPGFHWRQSLNCHPTMWPCPYVITCPWV